MSSAISRLRAAWARIPAPVLIGVVGCLLALAGLTSWNDSIVRYVTRVVDGISWWDVWRPAFDPPPMNTYTYRPLTVIMVKLELLLSGRDPFWMTVWHLPVVPWLGWATHRFLRTHGLADVATAGALTTMALPSMLFSGWIPVEPDTMGAAFLCEMGWALQIWRQTGSRKHLWLFVAFALGVATTKETSAAAGFGYLLAMTIAYWRVDRRRLIVTTLAYGVTLAVFVLPLILAKGQTPHDFHVQSEGFDWGRVQWMLAHNAAQVFYITSSAGAALVAVAALKPSGRTLTAVALLLVVGLLVAPPLRVYNHYESVIIDQIGYVSAWSLVLLLALLWSARPSMPPERRALVGTALFLPGVLVIAPIIALQSRPDVSARLYAPIVPVIAGLAWAGVKHLRDTGRGRLDRVLGGLIIACFWLFPVFGAANAIQSFRARMAIEGTAKTHLAELLKRPGVSCPFVIAVNRDHELAIEELQALGVEWTTCSELFVPNQVHLDPADPDLEDWTIQGHRYSLLPPGHDGMREALMAGRAPARCTYLYLQGPKSTMDTHDFKRFSGDFEWAFGNLPEFDEGTYQQQIELQFREQTGFQKLFHRASAGELVEESMYESFPLNANEIFGRLLAELPVIESYAYEGRVLFLDRCATP